MKCPLQSVFLLYGASRGARLCCSNWFLRMCLHVRVFKEVPDLSRVDTNVCISCGSSYQGPKVSSVMCMCNHVRHPTKPVGNRVTAKLRFSKSGHPWQSSESLYSETLRRNSSDLRKAHTILAVLLSATVLRCGRQPGKLNGEHQNSTAICIRC